MPVRPVPSMQREAHLEKDGESRFIATVDREKSVFFRFGQSDISSEGFELLRQHAALLKENDKLSVTLIGHTDDLGSPAYNLAIADRRVDAVYRFLVKLGVARQQLRRFSAGAEKNPASCRSSQCRRLLRRVELKYADETTGH